MRTQLSSLSGLTLALVVAGLAACSHGPTAAQGDEAGSPDSGGAYCDFVSGPVDAQAADPDAGIFYCAPGQACCQSGGVPGWTCLEQSRCLR